LAYWFQRNIFLNIFPIGSYVKTISADGGHLGWRSGSHDIILKVTKLGRNVHWMVIYKIFVFGADQKSNMAARAHNVF
jgi:hypothetical protein